MATKPTRMQQKALEHFAEALFLIAEGGRLDGGGRLGRAELAALGASIARASSAFDLDAIVVRALERKAAASGLPASAAELLTLLDSETRPLDLLLLGPEDFRAAVEAIEAELGDI